MNFPLSAFSFQLSNFNTSDLAVSDYLLERVRERSSRVISNQSGKETELIFLCFSIQKLHNGIKSGCFSHNCAKNNRTYFFNQFSIY